MGQLQGSDVDVVKLLQTLGNEVRKTIVTSLAVTQHPLRFSDLMQACSLDPNHDTGQFSYHLSELIERSIVMKSEEGYRLTQFGFKLGKLLETIQKECSFLLSGTKRNVVEPQHEADKPPFRIRLYKDTDFEDVARLFS